MLESVATNHEAKKVSAHLISWLQRWAGAAEGEGVGGDCENLCSPRSPQGRDGEGLP
jgi:hypothetical protein